MEKKRKQNVSWLIEASGGLLKPVRGDEQVEFTSIEYDSRKVCGGSLFVAVEGYEVDGHKFVKNAVDAGAAALIVSEKRIDEFNESDYPEIVLISAENTRKALSRVSSLFYGNPSSDMTMIGITGTNGKTSITYMIESALKHAGVVSGVIGTINYRWEGTLRQADNTTPESKDLQAVLAEMRDDGVEVVIMEVSSHGLFLNRVDDIEFDAAVFTNLTGDHLDFHSDFEDYFNAKMILFHLLGKSSKKKKVAVINTDDEYGIRIAGASKGLSFSTLTIGFNESADFRPDPETVENRITGLAYMLERPEKDLEIKLSLAGKFHIYNSLTAAAVLHSAGYSFTTIQEGFLNLKNVPGRFDVLDSGSGFHVIVDYAHTTDALLKLLSSVNELRPGKLITVFGCGGDRDRTKRPEMGKIAVENSDVVIVTSDNPRTEKPESIIEEIIGDLQNGSYRVVVEREEAIREAVSLAGSGDIIVIAGKGHEDYQVIGKTKIHFDDREIAAKYLAEKIAG